MGYDGKVLSEVVEILNYSEDEIKNKIPNYFLEFLNENMDKEYEPNIDFSKENWDDYVQEDTKALIAIIYRDYIVSEKERKELIKQEKSDELKKEQKLREKYIPDKMFENGSSPQEISQIVEKDEMIVVPVKENILSKILKMFKNFFNIK